ncbi:protein impact [Nannochloropsis oceanica]
MEEPQEQESITARRNEEVESLLLIYTEDLVKVMQQGDEYLVEIKLGKAENDENSRTVVLKIYLPPSYPSPGAEMPCFELRGINWSNPMHDQAHIYDGLRDIFHNQAGEVILFPWCEWLKEELHLLPITHSTAAEEGSGEKGDNHDSHDCEHIINNGSVLTPQAAARRHGLELIHGVPFTERKSTFQAHLARITTEKDARTVIECLLLDRKIQRASHNMYAFRVFDVKKQAQVNDNDDDGENAAGGKLAELIAVMGVNNVVIVVSRWWGGVLLGPSRFRVINNTARQLLEQCGMDRKERGMGKEEEGAGHHHRRLKGVNGCK